MIKKKEAGCLCSDSLDLGELSHQFELLSLSCPVSVHPDHSLRQRTCRQWPQMTGLVPKKMRSAAAAAWCLMTHRFFACSSTSSTCQTLMTLPSLSHLTWNWSARRKTASCSCRSLGTVWSSHPDVLSPVSHNWKINLQFVVTPCAHRTKTSNSSWPWNPVVLHSGLYSTSSRCCSAWPEMSGY